MGGNPEPVREGETAAALNLGATGSASASSFEETGGLRPPLAGEGCFGRGIIAAALAEPVAPEFRATSGGFQFEILSRDPKTSARRGVWRTPHGVVETPVFMPVGTAASVKGLTPDQLREVRVQKVLANTYHLALRPGSEVIRELGGLHRFMGWDRPILTDSGGFQVFSLSGQSKITDEEVVFRSHLDGSLLRLSPERAVAIQEDLGADCIMCLDECPAYGVSQEQLQAAVDRTTAWAQRCRDSQRRSDQALFGIVQGGCDPAMRERSADALRKLDFPGYALGGLSVGEDPIEMYRTLDFSVPMLPPEKPHYLMGVGRPIDLIESIARGIDLFDCVMPTRNGRNGQAFTSEGVIKLRNASYFRDEGPLDRECPCPVCRSFSRAYLRHLLLAKEMLGPTLVSWHNIAFYQRLMEQAREAISEQRYAEFADQCRQRFGADPSEEIAESE